MKLNYGNSIKIYRRKNKLKQEELAEKLQISKSMLGMLENNNRNASEEIEKRIKNLIGISIEKELQEVLLKDFEKSLIENFNTNNKKAVISSIRTDLLRNLKNLPEISKMYYLKLGETDFIEINKLLDNLSVLLPYVHTLAYTYYKKADELKLFYGTYTSFLLDNTDNIIDIINNYLSQDNKSKSITIFNDKLPLNIRKDFTKIIKSIDSTTYSNYNTYTLNTYSFERQLGFTINDDSMIPKYEIGNIVIINVLISNEIEYLESNKDYLIRINKDFFIRRIQIEDEQIIFKPLNYNYDVKTIHKDNIEKENIEIIGKITDIKIN